MSRAWAIKDSRLILTDGENEYFPTAEEIYSAVNGEFPDGFEDVPSLKESLPGLRFSPFGVELKISVSFQDQKLSICCFIEKNGNVVKFDGPVDAIPDSIIINDRWMYFTSSYDEIREVLKEAKISTFGEISLSEYITLSRVLMEHPNVQIENTAEEFLQEHPESRISSKNLPGLTASLYPYQEQGYKWLRFMTDEGCGCILADEMGLGKTLQVITLIVSRLNEVKTPALIIAPVSLLENWRREFEKFAGGVRVLIHRGPDRTGFYKTFFDYNVVITSYGTANSDLSVLDMVEWNLLVLDEAQNIKNPDALRTKTVKQINRKVALAVTGTPFENHMTDLWSLMDFIIPGALGTLSQFSSEFPDDLYGASRIEPVLTPLMIRRRVSEVAQDLPERIDIPQAIEFTDKEAQLYEEERQDILNEYGSKAQLTMLVKLRMFCTHPSLLEDSLPSDPCTDSTKYQRLCEILEEICDLHEKVILFTSYNKMFSILQYDIPKRFNIPVLSINGSTPVDERQSIIDRFSDISGTALLVLNPNAAGLGLNITAANRVIHYNLEWNPALEDQASARAYRRGQEKTVFIYRLFYKDTVEEIINERIEKKRVMSDTAVIGTNGEDTDAEDIMRALMISPKRD